MRYNLKFRKLTFYCLTRPQSIRKSKQISGQTILSSPQDVEFNLNFAKNRDIPSDQWLKIALQDPSRQGYRQIRFKQFTLRQIKSQFQIKSFSKPIILTDYSIFFRYNIQSPWDSVTIFHFQFQTGDFPQKMVYKQNKIYKLKLITK